MTNDLTGATKEIIEALKPLAHTLGQSAQEVYQLSVKDALITGHFELGWLFFLGVCVLICFVFICVGLAREESWTLAPIFILLGLIAVMCGVGSDCLHNLQNPEYMGIKDLLEQIKPVVSK